MGDEGKETVHWGGGSMKIGGAALEISVENLQKTKDRCIT